MATTNPQAQIQAALMPAALPQTLEPVTTKKRQVQYTQYDPQSVAAYNEAMSKVAPRASTAELLANALAGIDDAPSYEGAYGTQVSNPLVSGITNALQGFGGLYGARKQQEREYLTDMLNADRERARIQMEMGKKNIAEAEENGVMKVNTENSPEAQAEKQTMNKAAADALLTLYDLAESGEIKPLNNETGFWGGAKAQQNIGKRQAAFSALLPITNQIAKASGGSGINTLPEMMAYLGMVDNSTSEQLKGALPGVVNKMPQEVQALYAAGLAQRPPKQQQATNTVQNELEAVWAGI